MMHDSSFLDDELTVIALARLLDAPEATGLTLQIKRIWYYDKNGISPSIGVRFDREAVRRANIKRALDERELIGD